MYSDADRNSLHVVLADEAYNIGPAPSKDSYLNVSIRFMAGGQKSLAPKRFTRATGFLSENAEFAETLTQSRHHVHWPDPRKHPQAMGDKLSAIQAS